MIETTQSSDGFVATVVIPMRNEAPFIGACIDALGRQDLPLQHLEVVVVDGDSTDGSADLARTALERHAFGRSEVLVNRVGTTPSNLNEGLRQTTAPVVCRVDARSIIPPDYVRRCATLLNARADVVVTGGSQVARARGRDPRQAGIARALNNRWTMGMSKYRRGGPSGPGDTVYLGAFRTNDLQAAGGWDEARTTNQDFELNQRLGRTGAIWFQAGLPVDYVPRAGHLDLLRQYVRFGRAKTQYWRSTGEAPRLRQLAALSIAPAVFVGIAVSTRFTTRQRAASFTAVAVTAAVVESAGATEPSGGPAARAWAVVAIGCVWGGWSFGAWSELIRRRGRS